MRRRIWPTTTFWLAGVAAICLLLVWQWRLVGDFRIDDAYITFSYAKNLAHGLGPTYSHGVRVEGYSNFLWMLLLAGVLRVAPATDPYLAARGLAALSGGLLCWATAGLIHHRSTSARRSRFFALMAFVVLALDTDLVVAGLSGLETIAHAALLTTGLLLLVRGGAGHEVSRRLAIPCFVAVALIRIDGVAFLFIAVAAEAVLALRERHVDVRRATVWILPGVVVYLAWFGWQWWYYGLPLPTTYYAKSALPLALPGHGLQQASDFWLSTGLAALAIPGIAALAGPRRSAAVLLWFVVVAQTVYVTRVGGDWMPFWRFFTPVVPLMLVLACWGSDEIWRRIPAPARVIRITACGVGVILIAWVGTRLDGHSINSVVEQRKADMLVTVRDGVRGDIVPAARLLGAVVAPGEYLVSDYAGAMAFFTPARVIDMWGLNNAAIALRGTTEGVNPIWGKTCPSCYAEFPIDYFHTYPDRRSANVRSRADVIAAVWQSDSIGRFVDFSAFAAGRVTDRSSGRVVYFLERRRPERSLVTREPVPGVVIDYPFDSQ